MVVVAKPAAIGHSDLRLSPVLRYAAERISRAGFEHVARVARACVVMLESLRWVPADAGAAPLEGGQS